MFILIEIAVSRTFNVKTGIGCLSLKIVGDLVWEMGYYFLAFVFQLCEDRVDA